MPLPNEHSARLQDPNKFDPETYRRTKGGTIYGRIKVPKTIGIIWGKLKEHNESSDKPIPQALRFPVKNWTVKAAKKWLTDHKVKYIRFEPAAKQKSEASAMPNKKQRREQRHTRRVSRRAELRDVPSHFYIEATQAVELDIQAAEGEGEKRLPRFKGIAYSGGRMRPAGFWQDVVIDLAGMKVSARAKPVLKQHDPGQIVGHTDLVSKDGKILIAGPVSGTGDAAREVVETSANGFPWQLSVGADIEQMVFVDDGEKTEANGRQFTGPLLVARKSVLAEVSFVPYGADEKTSVKVAASTAPHTGVLTMNFTEWLEAKGFDASGLNEQQLGSMQAVYDAEQASNVPGDDPPADNETPTPVQASGAGTDSLPGAGTGDDGASATEGVAAALVAKARKELEAEMDKTRVATLQRHAKIAELCAGKHPDIEAKAIADNWSETKVELEILRAERPVAPAAHVADNSVTRQSMTAGLLLATGRFGEDELVKDYGEKAVKTARTLQPMSIPKLFGDCIRANGHTPPHGFGNDTIRLAFEVACPRIQAAGFTSVSLSGILGDSAYKTLLKQYNAFPSVAKQIAGTGSVKDFKEVTRYRLTVTGDVEEVGPDGELKHGSMDEESYTNQAVTYGKIVALTRTMIINDDLDAFLQIPRALGRGCANALEKKVFTIWLANTGSFFHADNKNLATSAPLDTAPTDSLGKANLLFRNQVDTDDNPIGMVPWGLLVPTTLEVVAKQLYVDTEIAVVGTAGAVTKRMKSNPFKGSFLPLATPWLENTSLTGYSTSSWYLTADPADVPAIEIVYLNGQQNPTLETGDVDFNQLGMQWRTYFDFGVAYQDPRAAVKATA